MPKIRGSVVLGDGITTAEDDRNTNSPQCASSSPFSQSFSLSQVQLIGIQRPLGQAKKFDGHFLFFLSDE